MIAYNHPHECANVSDAHLTNIEHLASETEEMAAWAATVGFAEDEGNEVEQAREAARSKDRADFYAGVETLMRSFARRAS